MYIPYLKRKRMKNSLNNKPPKKKIKLKNNRYINLRLNRRNASLIINALALARRYLYFEDVEEIPIEIFFDKNNREDDIYDMTLSIAKINEDCKNNFYNWKEFKIYK